MAPETCPEGKQLPKPHARLRRPLLNMRLCLKIVFGFFRTALAASAETAMDPKIISPRLATQDTQVLPANLPLEDPTATVGLGAMEHHVPDLQLPSQEMIDFTNSVELNPRRLSLISLFGSTLADFALLLCSSLHSEVEIAERMSKASISCFPGFE